MSDPKVDVRALSWTLEPLAALARHAATWDQVNALVGGLPFLESRFLLPLLHHAGIDDGWLAMARHDGVPVAAALLQRAGAGRVATVQPSQLPLGAWLASPACDGSALVSSLLDRLPAHCVALGITQQDPLFWPRPEARTRVRTIDYIETAWIEVAGPFDAFWEARGKNLRSNLRKQRNKLAGEGVSIVFDCLRRPEDMAQAVEEYGRLESAGWKAGIGTAVRADSAQGRFYSDMMASFCAAGRGQIWRLKFDDKTVAMDLCIEGQGTVVVLKTAYDPEYRSVSPAFLLKQEAFQRVFDEGRTRRIEFYGRLMEWHTRWAEQSRTLYHANVYRWDWVPRLRDWARRLRTPAEAAVQSAPAALEEAAR